MKTTDDIVRILSYGGGVVVDSSKTTDDLVRIAGLAAGKCTVIVKKAGHKTTDDLVRIASYGKGAVIFDLTD
jgi:hypothetical protein